MATSEELQKAIVSLLEREYSGNLREFPITANVDGTCVTLEGEVADIIAKRRIPHLLATLDGVHDIINHLRVKPSEARGDGAIRDALFEVLSGEPVFSDYPLVVEGQKKGPARTAHGTRGMIEVAVNDAVATLAGTVESLSHKRLADVLAWWTIGTVDVRNRLHVEPPEQGNDDEITDALRIVLEMDPWLDAGQIQVHTRNQKIYLDGLVRSPEQKHMAECNAWYILGVHEVINRIAVQA